VHLSFRRNFNQSLDKLPNNIRELTFFGYFELPMENIPNFITHITFHIMPKYSIEKLPNTITHLTLRYANLKPIKHFPTSLIELGFHSKCVVKNNIPLSVESVKIFFEDNDNYNGYITNLHVVIKHIKINLKNKIKFITKIPFNSIITDMDDNIILHNEL
jgi:hypothetical protein